jgi:hypothetical protein
MLNAMSQLQALVAALPELPDEVQGALAVRVPGLLDTPAAEVRPQLDVQMCIIQHAYTRYV